jgi:hypothetical protein
LINFSDSALKRIKSQPPPPSNCGELGLWCVSFLAAACLLSECPLPAASRPAPANQRPHGTPAPRARPATASLAAENERS